MDYDTLRERLIYLHDTNMLTWRQIGQLRGFSPVPFGTLYDVYKGDELPLKWYPHFKMRRKQATVVIVRGHIPEGTQVNGVVVRCPDCKELFVSNHPRRARCYLCSPFRGKENQDGETPSR